MYDVKRCLKKIVKRKKMQNGTEPMFSFCKKGEK